VLKFAEKLGNGGGVIAILIALMILDRRVIGRVPQLLAASLGAGLIADCLKLCVDRGRPYSLDLATVTFTSTFHGWFPLLRVPASEQGFPSGHATTAAGLAVGAGAAVPARTLAFRPRSGSGDGAAGCHARPLSDRRGGWGDIGSGLGSSMLPGRDGSKICVDRR